MNNVHIKTKKETIDEMKVTALFCCIIGLMLGCTLFFRSRDTLAAPAEETYKYYTGVYVESGDTLWEIAKRYITEEYSDIHTYMDEVCHINHISRDEIHAGQYLVVPYYSSEILR